MLFSECIKVFNSSLWPWLIAWVNTSTGEEINHADAKLNDVFHYTWGTLFYLCISKNLVLSQICYFTAALETWIMGAQLRCSEVTVLPAFSPCSLHFSFFFSCSVSWRQNLTWITKNIVKTLYLSSSCTQVKFQMNGNHIKGIKLLNLNADVCIIWSILKEQLDWFSPNEFLLHFWRAKKEE